MDDALFQYVLKLSAPEEMRLEGLAGALPPQNPLKDLLLGVFSRAPPPLPPAGAGLSDRAAGSGFYGPYDGPYINNGLYNNDEQYNGPQKESNRKHESNLQNESSVPQNNSNWKNKPSNSLGPNASSNGLNIPNLYNEQNGENRMPPEENGPVRNEGEELIQNLGQISDFLNSLSNFEPGDIPGLGGVDDEISDKKVENLCKIDQNLDKNVDNCQNSDQKSKSSHKTDKNIESELLTYSENAEKTVRAMPLSEKLGPVTNWVAQSATFSNFVLGRVRALAVAVIGELAVALRGDDAAAFAALPAKESAFFKALCATVGCFGAEGGAELRLFFNKKRNFLFYM